jgi:hypothetical protein
MAKKCPKNRLEVGKSSFFDPTKTFLLDTPGSLGWKRAQKKD